LSTEKKLRKSRQFPARLRHSREGRKAVVDVSNCARTSSRNV